MPIYVYQHPSTGERVEVIQHMDDAHQFFKDGIEWIRVFEAPQASTGDTIGNLDPFDKRAFIEKTGKMRNITQGDLWDLSKELSDKRAKKAGRDPVKQKTVEDYSKKCKGKKHPHADT